MHVDIVFFRYILSHVPGTVNGTVLASCTPETTHQMGKFTFNVSLYVLVHKRIRMI